MQLEKTTTETTEIETTETIEPGDDTYQPPTPTAPANDDVNDDNSSNDDAPQTQ